MAVPGMSLDHSDHDGPLRADDLPSNGKLRQLWDSTEAAVAAAAWERGAGAPRPSHPPRQKADVTDAEIFESALKG
jgi:hypothetical protein